MKILSLLPQLLSSQLGGKCIYKHTLLFRTGNILQIQQTEFCNQKRVIR